MSTGPAARLRILVAAPQPADVGAIASVLGSAGHEVETAYRLDTAIARLVSEHLDIVVVDPALPSTPPADVIGRLRGYGDAPLLVLADIDDDIAVGAAFDAGAVDVVGRPIRPLELLARIAAIARRGGAAAGLGGTIDGVPGDGTAGGTIAGDLPDALRVDVGGRRAEVAGRPLALTPIELDLLAAIAARRGGVVDHRLLVRAAWEDPTAVDPETLRAHLGRLNAKLIEAGHPGLRNARSRGYGLRVEGSGGGA
jgi:DNA-binding response OmpR family regulator